MYRLYQKGIIPCLLVLAVIYCGLVYPQPVLAIGLCSEVGAAEISVDISTSSGENYSYATSQTQTELYSQINVIPGTTFNIKYTIQNEPGSVEHVYQISGPMPQSGPVVVFSASSANLCSADPNPEPIAHLAVVASVDLSKQTQASLSANPSNGQSPLTSSLDYSCTNSGVVSSSNFGAQNGQSSGQVQVTNTTGTHNYSVTCDKNGQTSTASATVEAQLPPPPIISVMVISPADYGTPGSYSWTVTGGPSTYCKVYTSENTGGNGGPFLTEPLTSSKTITGLCSGPGGLSQDTETIEVNPPVALNACSASNITTTSALVRGSGGYGNYSWSVSSGSVSPGTTSNGGSVTLQGSAGASYSVVVRDQAGQENSCNVTLASIPSPVVACVRNTNPAVVGQNISFSATKSGGTGSGVTWSGDASGSGENISSQFSFGPHSVTANYEGASNACSFFVYNPVTCSLGPVSNMSVTVGASGGDGKYIWKTSGKISLDGTGSAASITFTAPGNYIIEVASNDGALTGTCSVKVDPPPLTCEPLNQTVVGNLASINAVGGYGNLSWAVQSGQEGTVSPTTGTSTNLTGKAGNSYVVSVTDQASQIAQCSVAFSAVTPPPTLTITATSNPVPYGSSTNIRWDSTNAQTCNLNGGDWKAPKGEGYSTGPLTRNITINGACTGPGGTCGDMATASGCATLTVVVSPPPALSACTVSNITTVSANIAGNGGFGNLQWSISEGVGGSLSNANGRGTTLIGKPGNAYTLTVTDEASQSASCSAALNVPNPTVTLTANPTAVSDNATTTLTWSSTNATVCTATQGPGFDTGRSTSGSDVSTALTYTGGPTYIFTIVCTGSSVVSDSREVTVNPIGVNATLTADPNTVTSGGTTTLTWSSTGATSCTAGASNSGFDTGNTTSGSDATTALTTNTTFTVSCAGPGGTATANASVTVQIPNPTVTLTANPTTVSDNGTTTLTWSSTNATVCTATEGPGFDTGRSTSGSDVSTALTYTGGTTYIFTIVCTGSSVVSDSREVTVNPIGVNATLTADPNTVTSGGTTTLTWSSTGATACTAGANSLGFDTGNTTAGSDATTALTANTTFTVSCTGPGGTATANASVTVQVPSPTVTLTANPTAVSDNATTTLTWSSTNATVCTATEGPGFDTRNFPDGTTSSLPLKFRFPGPNYIFTVVCSRGGGEIISDSVQVVVKKDSDIVPRGDGDGKPGGGKNIQTYPTLYNTSTAKVINFNVACGQLAAVWQAPEDVPEGYTMYYFDQRFNMWRELWNVRQAEVDTQVIGSELSYVKKFSPPNNDPTTLYRYRLHTYLGGVEFDPNSDATGSPLTAVWPCGVSFDMSNKDIVKVRDVALPYNPLANQDSNVDNIVPILENDEITFRINILNSGELPFSGDISVVDQLTNLAEPKDGWKAKVVCGNKCKLSVGGYNPDTKQLAFTITPKPRKTLVGGGVEVWAIEYTAKAKPVKVGNTAFLLQNKAFVNSFSSNLLTTKPLLVLPLGTTEFKEVQ